MKEKETDTKKFITLLTAKKAKSVTDSIDYLEITEILEDLDMSFESLGHEISVIERNIRRLEQLNQDITDFIEMTAVHAKELASFCKNANSYLAKGKN